MIVVVEAQIMAKEIALITDLAMAAAIKTKIMAAKETTLIRLFRFRVILLIQRTTRNSNKEMPSMFPFLKKFTKE